MQCDDMCVLKRLVRTNDKALAGYLTSKTLDWSSDLVYFTEHDDARKLCIGIALNSGGDNEDPDRTCVGTTGNGDVKKVLFD